VQIIHSLVQIEFFYWASASYRIGTECERRHLQGLISAGTHGDWVPLLFLTAGTQFPLKWTAQRERRVPNSAHRISGVW